MSDSPFFVHRLANGLTIVIEVMPHVKSAACGFLARTGARDDPAIAAGVSHFLEHMCFKGTPNRTWTRINIEFDEMGAYYNAFTSKDRTFYYSWVRTEDFDRQLNLLADMMRSSLPPEEFDMEKNVILEEIAMSADDLSSCAYDFLYEQVCPQSSLTWPVLGYERTIKDLTREQMSEYYQRRYAPNNLILLAAGNLEPQEVIRAAERCCGHWTAVTHLGPARHAPEVRRGSAGRQLDRFHQQAVLLAYPSVSACDPLDETAEAVAAILGGVNSRFYWNIIQKGISSRAGVFREEYADFALVVMFGLCEPENCETLLEAMRREARQLAEQNAENKEIQRVKNFRRTSLANESEAPFYRLNQLLDDIDYRGAPRTAADRLAAVEAVSADTIADYLARSPLTGEGFLVSVGPRQWPNGG